MESQETLQEQSGFDFIKVKRKFDESQVPMELLETSQEQEEDWTAVEIKVEPDDNGEERTSQDCSSDFGGSVFMDQDRSGSPGWQGDIQAALGDQWQGTAWIKEEIDADDLNKEDTFCQRGGTKTSWQGDEDIPISTQDVQNTGDPQMVNTRLKRADVENTDIDVANHPSFPSEVFCREGAKQEEHDLASLKPPCQLEGSQEDSMEREYKDSKDKVDAHQAFKIKSNLETHKKPHHSGKPFECTMCSALFDEKDQYHTHMRQHNRYPCMFCSESFTDKDELHSHVMSHPGSRFYVCGLCPERFHWQLDLRAHMLTHISERTLACDVCKKTFQWKKSLKKHLSKGHDWVKNHACGLCIEKFRFKKELQEHMKRVHRVVRLHTCNFCPKTFSKKHYLDLHMNIHTGEICDICSQAFSSGAELKLHIMTKHFEGRPYDCDFCSMSFKQKCILDQHRRWKHPEQRKHPESVQGVNLCTLKKCGYDVTSVKRDCDENVVNMESQETSQEQSGFDVIKVKRKSDESQVPMEMLETSQEQEEDWTAVEIKVEPDDNGEEGTSQDLSSDLGGSVSMDQDRSGSPGSQGDIPAALGDQWQGAAWIKEETDADDPYEEDTFCQRDGARTSWQGDEDTPISTQDVQNIGDPQMVNTWLKRAGVENTDIDVANHPSFPSEVVCREGAKQEEHDLASLKPPSQGEGSQEDSMEREYKDSEDKVDPHQIHQVCGPCLQACKIESNPDTHKEAHHSEKPFECTMCSESFDKEEKFNKHMRRHVKYACMFCSEAFRDKDELCNHVMSHPVSRLYACRQCPEAFRRKRDLRTHMRMHISGKIFTCDLCQKMFQWKKSLKRHLKKYHNS